MEIPADLKYSKEHEWVRVEGKIAVIGITDHAQEQLGDVVMVEIPAEGTVVTKDETFGVGWGGCFVVGFGVRAGDGTNEGAP